MAEPPTVANPAPCASPHRDGAASRPGARPFTASGARRTGLLLVLVHGAENLGLGEPRPPSTYVAARLDMEKVETTPRPRLRVYPRDDGEDDQLLANDEGLSRSGESNDNDGEGNRSVLSPDIRSTPFAVTRVVDRSSRPSWNEVLLLPVPIEWRRNTQIEPHLVIDIIRRDESQQEDTLVATAAVPMRPWRCDRHTQHLCLEFSAAAGSAMTKVADAPRVYVSITENTEKEALENVVELRIEDFAPTTAPVTSQQLAVLAGLVEPDTSPPASPHAIYDIVRDGENIDLQSGMMEWLHTPLATSASSHHVTRWSFPSMFLCRLESACTLAVRISAIVEDKAAAIEMSSVGVGIITFDTAGRRSGQASTHMIDIIDDENAVVGRLRVLIRQWDAPSWSRFQNERHQRRVICTNRRHQRRAKLMALGWTGAICRGLNRYPISSFFDEGGLTSVLAEFLGSSSDGPAHGRGDDAVTDGWRPSHVLNEHIRLLQQEIIAKQQLVQKLQSEGEERVRALRVCGGELVAARRDIKARDARIAELESAIATQQQREAQQTQELLSASQSGLRIDSEQAQRLNLLILKYRELQDQHKQTQAALEESQRVVRTHQYLEKQYKELEQAHLVQAALVQKLQHEKNQMADLQRVVKIQEKVIRKLEKAVMRPRIDDPPALAANPSKQPVGGGNTRVEEHIASSSATPDSTLVVRVQVLEKQLERNAAAAATEISRLKMRILELEALAMPTDGPAH